MRNLRAYIVFQAKPKDDKEAHEVLNGLVMQRDYYKFMGGDGLDRTQELVLSCHKALLRCEVKHLPKEVALALDKCYNNDYKQNHNLLASLMNESANPPSPLAYLFRKLAHCLVSKFVINGVIFRILDGKNFLYMRSITRTFPTTDIKLGLNHVKMPYSTKYGDTIYSDGTLSVGKNMFSLSIRDAVVNICRCQLYYKRGRFKFKYHICTNTLYFSNLYAIAKDDNCSQTRMVELWCIRPQLIRKMNQLASDIGVIPKPGEVICNFL